MRFPSGDQIGALSSSGAKVSRLWVARAVSMIQMSRFGGEPVNNPIATWRSSGERLRPEYSARSPTVPRRRPVRSNHVSSVVGRAAAPRA